MTKRLCFTATSSLSHADAAFAHSLAETGALGQRRFSLRAGSRGRARRLRAARHRRRAARYVRVGVAAAARRTGLADSLPFTRSAVSASRQQRRDALSNDGLLAADGSA